MNKYLILSAVFILVVAGVAYLYNTSSQAPEPNVEPTLTITPTQEADANSKTFTSARLGITFRYPSVYPPDSDKMTLVKEDGNKVYVGGIPNIDDGQSVEIFNKNKDESFEQAIRRIVLAEFPSKDCKIVVSRSNIYPGGYTADIDYPKPTNPEDPYWKNYELCNKNYSRTNGIRYFLYDEKYPDRFAFFSIGQYGIPLNEAGLMWQDTFKFIES